MLAVMSKKRAPKGSGRQGTPMTVYLPPALRAALDALADDNRRTLTAEVVMALEAHLLAAGREVPAADAAPADDDQADEEPVKRKGK